MQRAAAFNKQVTESANNHELPDTGSSIVVSETATRRTGGGRPHRRRKFTPQERAEVALVRKKGACHDCRTRRVKCHHAREQVRSNATGDVTESVVLSGRSNSSRPRNSSSFAQKVNAETTQSHQEQLEEHGMSQNTEYILADLNQNYWTDFSQSSPLLGQRMEVSVPDSHSWDEDLQDLCLDSFDDMFTDVETPLGRRKQLEVAGERLADIVQYQASPTHQKSSNQSGAGGLQPTLSDAQFRDFDRSTKNEVRVMIQPGPNFRNDADYNSMTCHALNGHLAPLLAPAPALSFRTSDEISCQMHDLLGGRIVAGTASDSEATTSGSRRLITGHPQNATQDALNTEAIPVVPWGPSLLSNINETEFSIQLQLAPPSFKTQSIRPTQPEYYDMAQQCFHGMQECLETYSLPDIGNKSGVTEALKAKSLYSGASLSDQAPVSSMREAFNDHAAVTDTKLIPGVILPTDSSRSDLAGFNLFDFQTQHDGLDESVFSSVGEDLLPSSTLGSSQPQKFDNYSTLCKQVAIDTDGLESEYINESQIGNNNHLDAYNDGSMTWAQNILES